MTEDENSQFIARERARSLEAIAAYDEVWRREDDPELRQKDFREGYTRETGKGSENDNRVRA